MNRKGFTLIEAIVVIVVVSILAVTVNLTLFSSYSKMEASSEARIMVSDIRYAQKLAISVQHEPREKNTLQTRIAGIFFRTDGYDIYENVVGFAKLQCSVNLSSVTLGLPAVNPIAFGILGTPVDLNCSDIATQNVSVYVGGVLNETVGITRETGHVFRF